MAQLQTTQVQSFGESLLVIITYVLIGYIMQRAGYLIPVLYNEPKITPSSSTYRQHYKQLLIFIAIKYIGNFLYYLILPLQYFEIISTALTAYSSFVYKNDDTLNKPFLYQNLIICITVKVLLLMIAGLFSMCLFYSRKRKQKWNLQSGILTNEADVTEYMFQYKNGLLHDDPLAKWCVFGLFFTSTYDISIGVPLIEAIFPYDDTDYTQYIYLYSLIQLIFIVPFCLLLLDIAVLSVQKQYLKLREKEAIIKQTMAKEREDLLGINKVIPEKQCIDDIKEEKRDISDAPTFPTVNDDTDIDTEYDEESMSVARSAALNVFLSSVNRVQLLNKELQQKEEIERISRLNALANYHASPTGSDIDSDSNASITPTNTDAFDINAPYEPKKTLSEMEKSSSNIISLNKKRYLYSTQKNSKNNIDDSESITFPMRLKIDEASKSKRNIKQRIVIQKSSVICKRLIGNIVLNPIILASILAFICKSLIPQSVLSKMKPYLNNVSSIYPFIALYIVGSLFALFFEERENIFKFAAAETDENKDKDLNIKNTEYIAPYIWTYRHSPSGSIHFRQKRMTVTEIDDIIKSVDNTGIPSSISLMNANNVMMWWWSLAFVLFRYFISSLSFRWINLYFNDRFNMEIMNYLYGTLTPNLLSVSIAMKYNIYISFITVSYMISIAIYPLIVFCGLFLFNVVKFDTISLSVGYVVGSVQICSIISALIVLLFWCGFKHWRTYPMTIFMVVLVVSAVYNTLLFCCEYYRIKYYYIIFSVYLFREWLRLLLLCAAAQCTLLISNYTVLKSDLKRYHIIIEPIIFIISLLFAFYTDKSTFDCIYKYNLECQYSSSMQLKMDLLIESLYSVLLMIMFCFILQKRYQYEYQKEYHNKKSENDKKEPLLTVNELKNINNLPQRLMVDGKSVEIESNFHKMKKESSIWSEYKAQIDCDPISLEIYYQFDYFAYSLIIFCVTLIGFIANVIFIIFLLHSNDENEANARVLELLMLLSVFQHAQTLFIAILFLSSKPIKRLTKNIWKRLTVQCRIFSQKIKVKVDDDNESFTDDDDDDDDNTKDNNILLSRHFYHRFPVLW